MFATNLILLLALIAMVAMAVWLFKDGEGAGLAPMTRPLDTEEDDPMQAGSVQAGSAQDQATRPQARPQVRVVVNDQEPVVDHDLKSSQSGPTRPDADA